MIGDGPLSAVVTGAASGLGEATARELALRGVHVVLVDRQRERGELVAAQVGGTFVEADVSVEEDIRRAIGVAQGAAPLRVLVNCAGISRIAATVNRKGEPFDLDVFESVLRVNLVGTFNCIRLAAQAMRTTQPGATEERGVIINTSSIAAFDGPVGQAAYCASKGGIVAMTLPVARDLARFGIRVNTIAPGLFDTPIFDTPTGPQLRERLSHQAFFPPRAGTPEEFAAMVMSIIANPYLNGQTIRLDAAAQLPPR